MPAGKRSDRYKSILLHAFRAHLNEAKSEAFFTIDDLDEAARQLGVKRPDNLPDNIYSFRHGRTRLPDYIKELAPGGKEWIVLPGGPGKYRFALTNRAFIEPATMTPILIADAIPEILHRFRGEDEQAVLASILYGRLIDIFLGVSSYRLQSHLRTSVAHFNGAQIEIDEVYVGTDRSGANFIIPIQAKGHGGTERISAVQLIQDHAWCRECHPYAIPRILAAKQIGSRKKGEPLTVALLEVSIAPDYRIDVVDELHFTLVSETHISDDILSSYGSEYERRSKEARAQMSAKGHRSQRGR